MLATVTGDRPTARSSIGPWTQSRGRGTGWTMTPANQRDGPGAFDPAGTTASPRVVIMGKVSDLRQLPTKKSVVRERVVFPGRRGVAGQSGDCRRTRSAPSGDPRHCTTWGRRPNHDELTSSNDEKDVL